MGASVERGRSTLLVEAVRGGVVESQHEVHAVVANRSGTVRVWGERAHPTIPRSAIKSIQALPLVTTGAADAFNLSQEELALACASHNAEPEHVEAVLRWLDRLGLSEDDLECGSDRPIGQQARIEWYANRDQYRPVYNGCSGKHTGFLTAARHLGEPTEGYIHPSSPAQQRVTAAIEVMTGLDLSARQPGLDGCGIPVFSIPLERLAFAMARLVNPVGFSADVAAAAARVTDAAQRAFWVSGTGRTEAVIAEHALEPVITKGGAEGVFMAALPERGWGIALKAADGRSRAARAAIKALLRKLDVLPPDKPEFPIPIRNKAGNISGEIRTTFIDPPPPRPPRSTNGKPPKAPS